MDLNAQVVGSISQLTVKGTPQELADLLNEDLPHPFASLVIVDFDEFRPPPRRNLPVRLMREDSKMPTRGSDRAIGLDLYANLGSMPWRVDARARRLIPTGVAVAVPSGYYGRVAPRSGPSVRKGLDVMAGVVDEDYRGEVFVLLLNTTDFPVEIGHHERVGQLILERADIFEPQQFDQLPDTARGSNGFGSTGA